MGVCGNTGLFCGTYGSFAGILGSFAACFGVDVDLIWMRCRRVVVDVNVWMYVLILCLDVSLSYMCGCVVELHVWMCH